MSDELQLHYIDGVGMELDDYLKKNKPSMIEDTDGTKPWIWVHRSLEASDPEKDVDKVVEEATAHLAEVTKKVATIEADDSIPTRGKKGVLSKKQTRDALYDSAAEKFKDLAEKNKCTTGKWLFFPPRERVDGLFSILARSVIKGPLSKTPVKTLKVATCPPGSPEGVHVICLYFSSCFDKGLATDILKVLLKSHGLVPSAVKSDIYTIIGLDSHHPSKMPSSLWSPQKLLSKEEIEALKKEYEETKKTAVKTGDAPAAESEATGEKRRAGEGDDGAAKSKAQKTTSKPAAKPVELEQDVFDGGSDDDD